MSESKTVQEVQKELIAAVQRGREQVRKGQEQVRKGQEQMRKGQEQVRKGVVSVVSEVAKSVAHSVPAGRTVHIPTRAEAREHAREMASHAIAVQRDLAAKAWHATEPYAERVIAAQRDLAERVRHADVAEQVAAAQRTLSDRVAEAARFATPFVAEGRARLSHVVGARTEASEPEAAANGAGEPALAESREQVVKKETPAPDAAPAEAERKAAAATPKPATAKASPTKASTAKAGTARAAGTSKPRTPKK